MAERTSASITKRVGKIAAELAVGADYISLPVSVLSKGDRRLDGESFLNKGYGLRLRITRGCPWKPLGEYARIWQPSRLKGITVSAEHGLPFLAATQVFDLRPLPRKYLAPERTDQLAARYVDDRTILVTCSGSVGDALLAYAPHRQTIISHDLLRVEPNTQSDTGFLYSFLRSSIGRALSRSNKYGSIIKHLEWTHLADLPVPDVPTTIRDHLDRVVGQVFDLRDAAFSLVLEAEEEYAQSFPSADPKPEVGFTARASEMLGRRRLDAHHHNPGFGAVAEALRHGAVAMDSLEDATENIFGVARFKHVYGQAGIPYLDSEDLFKVNPEISKFIPAVTKRNAHLYEVWEGWVLMACSGQLYGLNGSSILATAAHEGKIVSNHVVRIVPKNIRPGYLALVLGHPTMGRPLVQRLAFGSEVPEISPADLSQMTIPRLAPGVETRIAEKVEEAGRRRSLADALEDGCARFVEVFLEAVLNGANRDGMLRIATEAEDYSQSATGGAQQWAAITAEALKLEYGGDQG